MMKIIKCECSESLMLRGRCVGCGRIRPSSQECYERLRSLNADVNHVLTDLSRSIELESSDSQPYVVGWDQECDCLTEIPNIQMAESNRYADWCVIIASSYGEAVENYETEFTKWKARSLC